MLSQAELIALRLLVERPSTMVIADVLQQLLDKGLVERRAGSLVVTSRGHAAILQKDSGRGPDAA